ncbi:MAG: lamin tail domain-containing protein [Kofleriaceae bacterium]|nr:lamin tail domain-containing protein [Kofleriaceae bacterium]
MSVPLSAVAALTLSSCFDPGITRCAVQCGEADLCPSGATCLSDGMCHSSANESLCSALPADAAQNLDGTSPIDATTPDASTSDASLGCGDGIIQNDRDETCDDGNEDAGDGCSDVCRIESGFFCFGTPSDCATAPGPGQLIITEIQKDPCADQGAGCLLNDISAEWFEVQNVSNVKLQLLNMIIRDDGIESITVSTPLTVAPGQRVVLGNNSNTALNGDVTLDYQYMAAFFVLANGADEIILVNPLTSVEIDRVFYNTVNFPDFRGSSLSLDPDFYDGTSNDDGLNWCDGDVLYGPGDFGTPGQVNPQCP